jgi:FkbM family methyltransferase
MIRKLVETSLGIQVVEWDNPQEGGRDWDEYLLDLINMWSIHLFLGDLVIDIGAHTGDTAMALGYLSGNVIAFEPNPEVFPILQQNTILNSHLGIRAFDCAIIAEKKRHVNLYDYSASNCNMGIIPRGEPKFVVSGFNLEYWCDSNAIKYGDIKFIKIDCEGYDLEIFNSIPHILETKPVIYMEWFDEIDDEKFLSSIRSAGYRVLNPDTLKEIDEKIPNVLCIGKW